MTGQEANKQLEGLDNCYNQLSDDDREALDMAMKAVDKCDEIKKIINDWAEYVPWPTSRTVMQVTLLRIEDVLEEREEK